MKTLGLVTLFQIFISVNGRLALSSFGQCSEHRCYLHNGVLMDYPFGASPGCGHPDFQVDCHVEDYPVIKINNTQYKVNSISYPERTLRIVDKTAISSYCYLPNATLNATIPPFQLLPHSTLVFFLHCKNQVRNYSRVNCTSDSYLVFADDDGHIAKAVNSTHSSNCRSTYEVPTRKLEAVDYSTTLTQPTKMKRSRANTLDHAFIFANAIAVWLVYSHGAGVEGRQFTLVNKCSHVVCPGIQPAAGQVVIARGGLCLAPETAKTIEAPAGWSGRIWGRHGCTFDEGGNHGFCSTGDCEGVLFCNGASFSPPATIVDITFSANSSAPDFYDVSLVDGYNLPVIICPSEGGSGQCPVVGCPNDINVVCPHCLQVVEKESVVACKSACMAFDSPEYCCTGRYGEPTTCKPSLYSKLFKSKCPLAYSYSHDDARRVACAGGLHYDVTFCPGV